MLHKIRPDNDKLPQAPENEGRDLSDIQPAKRAKELLKSFYGQDDWDSLETSLAEGVESLGV